MRQAAAVPFDLTPGLAEDIARSRILDAIRAEFGDYELLEETPSAEEADGAVTLTLRVRMLADIGKMVPYEGGGHGAGQHDWCRFIGKIQKNL